MLRDGGERNGFFATSRPLMVKADNRRAKHTYDTQSGLLIVRSAGRQNVIAEITL